MYFGSLHWRPLGNGYSGFLPPSVHEIGELCRILPDGRGIEHLRGMGSRTSSSTGKDFPGHPEPRVRARALRQKPYFETAVREAGGREVFTDGSTGDLRAGGPG